MRIILWVIVVLVAGFIGWKLLMTAPPQDLPQAQVGQGDNTQNNTATTSPSAAGVSGSVNREKSTVSFVGYGPGKEHPTTFDWTENLTVQNGVLAGSVTFDTASVKTGIAKLDEHLCSPDFFNCPINKQVVFTITSASQTQVTGTLAFAGKTHTVTFPVTVSGDTMSADFRLDRTPFNFKYTIANATAVDKEVRVQFNLLVE